MRYERAVDRDSYEFSLERAEQAAVAEPGDAFSGLGGHMVNRAARQRLRNLVVTGEMGFLLG